MLETRGTASTARRSSFPVRAMWRSTRSKRCSPSAAELSPAPIPAATLSMKAVLTSTLIKEIKEMRARAHRRICRSATGAGVTSFRGGRGLGRAVRRRHAVGHAKRAVRQGCAALVKNGVIAVGEGANMPCTRKRSGCSGGERAIRSRQGGQCRRGRHERAGNAAERRRDSWTFERPKSVSP